MEGEPIEPIELNSDNIQQIFLDAICALRGLPKRKIVDCEVAEQKLLEQKNGSK